MEREKAEYTPAKLIDREGSSILFFCFPPPLIPVLSPTTPSCQNICDLYHMASKEEVLRQPKSQQVMEEASHLVLVSVVKPSQCPLIGRAFAQLLYVIQILLGPIRGNETEWQYSSTNETVNCYVIFTISS